MGTNTGKIIKLDNDISPIVNKLDMEVYSINDKIIEINKDIKSVDKKVNRSNWEHRKSRRNSNKRWKHHR